MANRGRSLIAVIVVAALVATFAALLATGRIASYQPQASLLSANPTQSAYATSTIPPPPPIPTLGPLPTQPASCPQSTQMQAGTASGEGIGVRLEIPQANTTGNAFELSLGTGVTIQGSFYYSFIGGRIISPSAYHDFGFAIVTILPIDPCAYKTSTPTPQGGGTYVTSSAIGGILFNGVSGDVATFTTTKGVAGSFNYVTGQFSP